MDELKFEQDLRRPHRVTYVPVSPDDRRSALLGHEPRTVGEFLIENAARFRS